MKIFAPSYYQNFKCISNKCNHSCCIGWEIDIDDETFEYYQSIDSNFGDIIRKSISTQDGCKCFKLDEKERCPFLNNDNLCDIILNLGEDALCQICTDHPRFRNYYSDRIEIGLGLCCEEAARIILTNNEKINIIKLSEDGIIENNDESEVEFFSLRKNTFDYFQDKSIPITNKIFCSKEQIKKYQELEILDDNWLGLINCLIDKYDDIKSISIPRCFEMCFEQLLIYFTYRHFPLIFDGKRQESIIDFIQLSVGVIYALCQLHISEYQSLSVEDIAEYSRMYSSEIEYSQENLDTLIKKQSLES